MTPTGIRWIRNGARSRFKLMRVTNGTYLLAASLVLSAFLATIMAQGHAGNTTTEEEDAQPRSRRPNKTEPNCFVPPNAGNCNGRLFRYYFHWGVGRCIRYVYTGCNGTGNNFRSKHKCMKTCWFQNYNIYCKLPMDRGQCGSWVVRYHYDKDRNHCFPFWYSGCAGNLNNFRSAQECRAVCIPD